MVNEYTIVDNFYYMPDDDQQWYKATHLKNKKGDMYVKSTYRGCVLCSNNMHFPLRNKIYFNKNITEEFNRKRKTKDLKELCLKCDQGLNQIKKEL